MSPFDVSALTTFFPILSSSYFFSFPFCCCCCCCCVVLLLSSTTSYIRIINLEYPLLLCHWKTISKIEKNKNLSKGMDRDVGDLWCIFGQDREFFLERKIERNWDWNESTERNIDRNKSNNSWQSMKKLQNCYSFKNYQ